MNTLPRNDKRTLKQEILSDLYDLLYEQHYNRIPYVGYRVEFNYPWKSVELLGPFTKNQGITIDINEQDLRITTLQWNPIGTIQLADPNYKQTLIKLIEDRISK